MAKVTLMTSAYQQNPSWHLASSKISAAYTNNIQKAEISAQAMLQEFTSNPLCLTGLRIRLQRLMALIFMTVKMYSLTQK